MRSKTLSLLVLAAAGGLGAACEKKESAPGATGAAGAAAELPAGLFTATRPEGALDVAAAKGAAKAGEPIVLRGRIGGGMEPFVDGRAVLTIMDVSVPACSDVPGDECATPWDYCCEAPESIAKNAATVRVVNASGASARAGLKGAGGLKELSEVIVVGTVAQADGNLLVVDAREIHVVGG